ncbi:MAG: asparaginase [Acidimicrobiia bacterium]|nr:asparaginase [Acidimicrobiia bacterium]
MYAATIRSGLVESTHPWVGAAVVSSGEVVAAWGDIDRPLFYRSAIKALQATASLEAGAELDTQQLALACASHSGQPVHVAIVESMLTGAGLDETRLQCPAEPPLGRSARMRLIQAGNPPRRILHNCSGKHAAFLMACQASHWALDGYLDPEHPLQRRVIDLVEEVSGVDPRPVGIDGCGAPTLRGTVRALATCFARLSDDPRLGRARTATMRYPALTSGNDRADGRFAMWWGGPSKGGAEGLMAAARNGVGLAVKSLDGSLRIAVIGLIEMARRLDLISPGALAALAADHAPAVVGGGRQVGSVVADIAGWQG